MSSIQSLDLNNKTLRLPRLLCLHGGGTNARIFRAQCRVLEPLLAPYFRLVYADAPFDSETGPDVTAVYGSYGPFRRWLRWKPEHPEIDPSEAVKMIQESLAIAVKEDDKRGATGDVVGLLGFSQGAKVAASLLLEQQVHDGKSVSQILDKRTAHYYFAVLLAARGPLVAFDSDQLKGPNIVDAGHLGFQIRVDKVKTIEHILHYPTLHVHGFADPGLEFHKKLLDDYFDQGTATVIEWGGHHRVPIQRNVVQKIVKEILRMAMKQGILIEHSLDI